MSNENEFREVNPESVAMYRDAVRRGEITFASPEFLMTLASFYLQMNSQAEGKADYFDILVDQARQEAAKAIEKYPHPNYTMLKFSEEAGEVIKGAVHYSEGRELWVHVEQEIVQTLAMLIRFLREGDGINKIYPPVGVRSEMKGNRDE